MKRSRIFLLSLLIALPCTLFACAVPVFRYALERWPPDAFQLTVLHKGMEQEQIDAWLNPVYDAHMAVLEVDLREDSIPEEAPDHVKELANEVTDTSPRFLLEYPFDYGFETPILSGAVSDEQKLLVQRSPVRDEIIKRLLGGHSTVWVFIPGTDASANDELKQLIKSGIQEMNETLELPEKMLAIYSPEKQEEVRRELPIHFSMLELDRNDPKEKILTEGLRLVLGDDTWNNTEQAWVMPVFGQGRALAIEDHKAFTADMLREMSYFLTGSCSCEVKELNPGFDLFIVEPWMEDLSRSFVDEANQPPELFNPLAYEPETEDMALATEGEAEPEAETAVAPTPTPSITSPAAPAFGMNWGVVLGGGVVVLLAAGVMLSKHGGGDA